MGLSACPALGSRGSGCPLQALPWRLRAFRSHPAALLRSRSGRQPLFPGTNTGQCPNPSYFRAVITTVIFDMDGLLLDTEPLWGRCMLRAAEKHQVPLDGDCFRETTGLRIGEVTDYWAIRYPWQGITPAGLAEEILDDIIHEAQHNGSVLPGVEAALQLLKAEGFKVGLASSSPLRMITALTDHFGITGYFDVITSADAVALGKPHPAVFLHCAELLASSPLECLVLEDSINGVIAAKAARMKVIAIPDAHHYNDPRFAIADAKLPSMEAFELALLAAY